MQHQCCNIWLNWTSLTCRKTTTVVLDCSRYSLENTFFPVVAFRFTTYPTIWQSHANLLQCQNCLVCLSILLLGFRVFHFNQNFVVLDFIRHLATIWPCMAASFTLRLMWTICRWQTRFVNVSNSTNSFSYSRNEKKIKKTS
jgi:hypothetical protein